MTYQISIVFGALEQLQNGK